MHFIPALGDPNAWREIIEDQRVEGCLVVPPMPYDLPAMLRNLRMPAVLMNVQTTEPLPQFLPDDANGMRMLMQHLWDLGHRRIAFALSPATHTHHSVGVRREAFEAFAAEHGIADGCVTVEAEPEALVADLKGGKVNATAIISYKASYAIELLHMLWRAGLVVPRDVSLATFDDSWVMAYLHPPLTAVSIPMNEIARRSANLLIDALEGPVVEQTLSTTLLPEGLVLRESTAPVPVDR
jgi:LacI family transcriptional regulator